jgi:hypothetical protein
MNEWMLTFRWFSVYQKYNKNDYSNYQLISLYSTAYKYITRRSQCSRGLRCGSVGVHLLEWGFESRRGHRGLSYVTVVCFQVDSSGSVWSLVQRSPTECGVSECDCEASIMRGPWYCGGLSNWQKMQRCITVYMLTGFWDEIIVNVQCGLRRNRSKADCKFCIRKIVEKETWQSREELQIFTEFKKALNLLKGLFYLISHSVLYCHETVWVTRHVFK